uniref:Uncharacterized protein n=1 Tax=Glossina palpalis gambiensis TaxID=67801 RepID=A0A1B0B0F7_9MUSC
MFNKHCAEDYNKNSNKQNLTEILASEISSSSSSSSSTSNSHSKARVIFKAISIFIHLCIKWASHGGDNRLYLADKQQTLYIVSSIYILWLSHQFFLFLSSFASELIALVRPRFVLRISPPFVV